MKKSLIIDEAKAKTLYKPASKELKEILEETFGKAFFSEDICDLITDFNSVLKLSGKTLKEILPWSNPKNKQQISQNAFAKLQLITEVYNEGEISDWDNINQTKHYNWFEKKSSGWVWSCVHVRCYGSGMGFGLFFTTNIKAKDAGNKFLDIYNEYLP